jgi:hypothetical protein
MSPTGSGRARSSQISTESVSHSLLAYHGRQVVCTIGDGGFRILMGEIATLIKYQLPVKIVVIKNNVLGEIKWEQQELAEPPTLPLKVRRMRRSPCDRRSRIPALR